MPFGLINAVLALARGHWDLLTQARRETETAVRLHRTGQARAYGEKLEDP